MYYLTHVRYLIVIYVTFAIVVLDLTVDVFALVTYCKERDSYLLTVYNEENMRSYEPDIVSEYQDHNHFRHLLLVKCKVTYASSYIS